MKFYQFENINIPSLLGSVSATISRQKNFKIRSALYSSVDLYNIFLVVVLSYAATEESIETMYVSGKARDRERCHVKEKTVGRRGLLLLLL